MKQFKLIFLLILSSFLGLQTAVACTYTGYVSTQNNGTYAILTVHTSGTQGQVTYSWYPDSSSNNTVTVTASGIYCVRVADSTGCYTYFCDTVSLTSPCTLHCHVTYRTLTGGGAVVYPNPDSGMAPYTYHWSNSNTGDSTSATASGLFCVTVTDHNGCTATSCDSVIVTSPCNITGYITTVNDTTHAILTVHAGGTHGHTSYYWSPDTSTSASVNVTASGAYCVRVSDSTGCYTYFCDTVHLTSCTIYSYVLDSVHTGYDVMYPLIYSGTPPYTYHWSTGSTSSSISASVSGRYCVTVTDHNGCTTSSCDSVTIAPACSIYGYVSTANDTSHAVLTAHVGGTHGLVSYRWDPDTSSTATVNVTTSGVYCVRVSDTTGCYIYICDTVHLTACSIYSYVLDSVRTGYDIMYARVYSGTAPYTYHWSNGNTGSSTSASVSGRYCVTVTDHNGCTTSSCDSVTIAPVCSITGYVTTVNDTTHAVLTVHPYGTHGAISYNWSTGTSTTSYVNVTSSGIYCVRVSDSTGCYAYFCDTVHLNTCNVHAYIIDSNHTTSHTLFAYAYLGSAPYSYHWSTGGYYSYIDVTHSGTYCLTVTDSTGCSAVYCDSVLITTAPCSAYFNTRDSCGTVYFFDYSSGTGLSRLWYFGDSSSATGFDPHHSYAHTGTYLVTLIINNGAGCIDTFRRTVSSTSVSCLYDTICGTVFYDNNGNGVQDSGEAGLAGQHIYAGSYSGTTNSSGQYIIVVPAGTYSLYYHIPSGMSLSIPVGGNQSYGIYDSVLITSGVNCGFNFGVVDSNVTISGYVYLDANGNGVMDPGEAGIAYAHVYVGTHSVYTNSLGYYVYVGPASIYTVSYTPAGAYSSYTVTPASYTVNALVTGAIFAGNNFGLHTAGTTCNISTDLMAITTVTAGFPAFYSVYVSNSGSNIASGTMTFYYDPALTFDYSSPAQTSINTISHFITFNYDSLQPGMYKAFFLLFTADTTVLPGQTTFELATATDNCIESNLADNTDTVIQNATASWDPNSKVVTPSGTGPQGFIASDQELQYTLNFQNTGTAPAVNVVLNDFIPATLDLTTLRVVGASHPGLSVQMQGNELIARFSQIMLPDSSVSQLGSHGYLTFAITPVAGTAPGTQIQNTASIYFDYNAGVNTNTTLNTINYPLSISDIQDHATITIAPNPFHDHTTISIVGGQVAGATLEVYDLLGQPVHVSSSADGVFQLNRAGLSAGVYIYYVRQAGGLIGSGKLVIE